MKKDLFGLREEEYRQIKETLQREPNDTELGLFGVMWSEHCCYKSTKRLLAMFPTKGRYVFQGPGENAGIVDIGSGIGIAFKMESHNHPSAVEPVQGAATGVGGIIRDVIAMGARPIASMDCLFFGPPDDRRSNYLREGIIKGIGSYGNCVGIPTVGGLTYYDPCYTGNPLVNAMCAGLVRLDGVVKSDTSKPGHVLVLLGSKTGRDGIAGAAFASAELDEAVKKSKPQVQMGDPFAEKLLIECCLEILDKGFIVSMQDMGAAGITSSAVELAAKAHAGAEIYLDNVPLREEGMNPFEIALSESQERMLLVIEERHYGDVKKIADKWGLECANIGRLIEQDRFVLYFKGQVAADVPASMLASGPTIDWPKREPAQRVIHYPTKPQTNIDGKDPMSVAKALSELPQFEDKSWIYEQYDHMVQTRTTLGPGNSVAIIYVKEIDRLIALSAASDPWRCAIDPLIGGMETVAKAVRKLAVAGAYPLGMTDCLNFPSPEVPENFWTMSEVIRGMALACRELDCPIVSGNVSLYNESPQGAILPSPVVCAVGCFDDEKFLKSNEPNVSDKLFLVGSGGSLKASAFERTFEGRLSGPLEPLDFDAERDFCSRARKTALEAAASSGRCVGLGGVATAIIKMLRQSNLGAAIKSFDVEFLFGEGCPRALYAVPEEKTDKFLEIWDGFKVTELGSVIKDDTLRFV